jgi:hypothetical protein
MKVLLTGESPSLSFHDFAPNNVQTRLQTAIVNDGNRFLAAGRSIAISSLITNGQNQVVVIATKCCGLDGYFPAPSSSPSLRLAPLRKISLST